MAASPQRLLPAFATAVLIAVCARADVASLERAFAHPPDDAKIMVRWWWFGPAVTAPQLEREMKLMQAGGIGGFEVQPTYPLAVDGGIPDLKNLKFLSPEFLAALGFTASKAKELGLRFDLTLGSGWPYGGPMFGIDEAAGRLRVQSVDLPAGATTVGVPPLHPGEKLLAAFLGGEFGEIEIRDHFAYLPAPATAPAQVRFFVAGHTGMKVKRPAVGAEGYVLDHYAPAAVEKFLRQVAEPEIRALGDNIPATVFCDSLEVAGGDWTENFLGEFRIRRGYDLRPLLPALAEDSVEKAREIRHDWGRTLTELFNEHFLAPLQRWSHEHHTRVRVQSYGSPPGALFSYAYADLAEGEGPWWKDFGSARVASSASHLLGRAVTSSETWTWLHSPVFRATPLDMKAEADVHFLQGVNQLVAHGWPYTPEGMPYPGWRFYAAAVFNDKNPWWIVMPDITAYLQRVSYLLRQGRPANDVALYLSNSDAWSGFTLGRIAWNAAAAQNLGHDVTRELLQAGFNFDFIDDDLLKARGRIDGGVLAFGELRYKIVVLPGVEHIPLATMRALEKFARNGGLLVATKRLPAIAPGYNTPGSDSREVAAIAQRLFTGPDAPGLFVEDENQLGTQLVRRAMPDVALLVGAPELGFVHRHTDSAEFYFLANTGNTAVTTAATFRVTGANAEWWDPMTGKVEAATILSSAPKGAIIALDLAPYESRILAFTHRELPPAPIRPGKITTTINLTDGWSLAFSPDSTLVAMARLASWTDNEATKYFSGVVSYRKSFEVSGELGLAPAKLSFGEGKALPTPRPPARGRGPRFRAWFEAPVREAAIVYVNGRRAGALWHPPYQLDVSGLLVAGHNELRVEVANLAVNHMAGHPLPDYRALIANYGERFQAQDMNLIAPVPAGLFGPIELRIFCP